MTDGTDPPILFYCEQVFRVTPKSESIEHIAAVILTSGFRSHPNLHADKYRHWYYLWGLYPVTVALTVHEFHVIPCTAMSMHFIWKYLVFLKNR